MASESFLPDAALAAAYVRRLGFSEEDVSGLVTTQPLGKGAAAPKSLLAELARRHQLRIPYDNLETFAVTTPFGQVGPKPVEERLGRLSQVRLAVQRLVFGSGGGTSFDLNLPFAWLLRQLGAKVKLTAACMSSGGAFSPTPQHVAILVMEPVGPALVDVAYADPIRTILSLEGETMDDIASYEVADLENEHLPGFTKVLRRQRDNGALNSLFQVELESPGAWTDLYAFRPEDDLAYDADEFKAAIQVPLESGRLVSLALGTGQVVLSDNALVQVEGGDVTRQVKAESPEAWAKAAAEIYAGPLVNPPKTAHAEASKRVAAASLLKRESSDVSDVKRKAWSFAAGSSEQMTKTASSQEAAFSKAQNLGVVSGSSLAVGGAGQGGGLGLNAPGFGPKVQHFAGKTDKKSIDVAEEIGTAWSQVLDDTDPLGWVFCEYSADGKKLELKSKGPGGVKTFREQLGDKVAWGGFRCSAIDRRGGVDCRRPKFIFVQYKPENLSAIKKAKQGAHKGDVKDCLFGAHLDVVVESLHDLKEEDLIAKLQAATGAHKPNGYEFEDGEFMEADFYGLGIGKECKGETSKN